MANPIPDQTRYTYVYHPSRPHKERWEKAARKAHTSLSKFIIAAVDGLLDENEEFAPRREMLRELETLKKDLKAAREDNQRKSILIERYEAELKRYRATPWLEEDFIGYRQMSEQLSEILRTCSPMQGSKLLEALGIDRRETDLIKAVNKQLQVMEGYGVIKQEGRYWQWIA